MYLLGEFEQSFNCMHRLENIFNSISTCQVFRIYGRYAISIHTSICLDASHFFIDLQCQKKSHGSVAAKSDFNGFGRDRHIFIYSIRNSWPAPLGLCVYSLFMPSPFARQLNQSIWGVECPNEYLTVMSFPSALQIAQTSRLNLGPARLLPPTMRSGNCGNCCRSDNIKCVTQDEFRILKISSHRSKLVWTGAGTIVRLLSFSHSMVCP